MMAVGPVAQREAALNQPVDRAGLRTDAAGSGTCVHKVGVIAKCVGR
jgi:hypothetical protein